LHPTSRRLQITATKALVRGLRRSPTESRRDASSGSPAETPWIEFSHLATAASLRPTAFSRTQASNRRFFPSRQPAAPRGPILKRIATWASANAQFDALATRLPQAKQPRQGYNWCPREPSGRKVACAVDMRERFRRTYLFVAYDVSVVHHLRDADRRRRKASEVQSLRAACVCLKLPRLAKSPQGSTGRRAAISNPAARTRPRNVVTPRPR